MNKYPTFQEYKDAVKQLNPIPKTIPEYVKVYKQDTRLCRNPDRKFRDKGWLGWRDFFCVELKYQTLQEHIDAIQMLTPIPTTAPEYAKVYIQDTRLARYPHTTFKNKGWQGWADFLDRDRKNLTLEDYKAAVQKLNPIPTTIPEYVKVYKQQSMLIRHPDRKFKDNGWLDWFDFLCTPKKYQTFQEHKDAVQQLTPIPTNVSEYVKFYKQDKRLCSQPDIKFKDKGWMGWGGFLSVIQKYQTLQEQKEAVQKLNPIPRKVQDYLKVYKQDPRLQRYPYQSWLGNGWLGWPDFLGMPPQYQTLQEHKDAVQKLNPVPSTMREYTKFHRQDPRLSHNPEILFKNNGWSDWGDFLDTVKKYTTLQEYRDAIQKLNPVPKMLKDYKNNFKQNPRLTSNPDRKFNDKGWVSWYDFLGNDDIVLYETEEEAMAAVQRLVPIPRTVKEYKKVHKQDPRLPSQPTLYYNIPKETGLAYFLAIKYFNYAELKSWTDTLDPKPTNVFEWNQYSKKERKVPSHSDRLPLIEGFYDFQSLVGVEYLNPLDAIQLIHKIKPNLASLSEYKELQKLYGSLPKDPVHRYGFESFPHFLSFDKSKIFNKKEAKAYCQKHKIQTAQQYEQHATNTPELPLKPSQIKTVSRLNDISYKPSICSVFDSDAFDEWVELADKHCSISKNNLKRYGVIKSFFLYFKEELNPCVEKQCSEESELIDPTDWFNTLAKSSRQLATLNILQLFFEFVLEQKCAHISEDGEVVYIEGYRMPIKFTNLPVEYINLSLNETNKRALPFKYIQNGRNFIATNKTQNLGDIYHHITKHGLDYFDTFTEWFEVDERTIDKSDPNCIWKFDINKGFLIWSPVKIVATLFQLYTPFRGSQIVWSDSGEADKFKLVNKNGQYIWQENTLLADYRVPEKHHQGLLKPSDFNNKTSSVHLHINTNKTAHNAYSGYDVPYIDDRLLPFLLQLRDWQTKYNPIKAPIHWYKAKTSKSSNQNELLKFGYQGRTCFLFRNPCDGDGQSPIKQSQLANTFAAVLSLIEDKELPLTTLKGRSPAIIVDGRKRAKAISNIQPLFTLHCMRVSLITAYIRDAKIAPEIIQKLVGHSSLVMTIYYIKVEAETIRDELMQSEGRIIMNQVKRIEQMIRQQRMDELSSELIDSQGKVKTKGCEIPAALYSIMDFGLCPVGRTLCNEGSSLSTEGSSPLSSRNTNRPVEAGYLGTENCLRCRFFQTGPAFLGGLQMLSNEISLECKAASLRMEEMRQEIEILEDMEYQAMKAGEHFKDASKLKLSESHYQSEATRFDGLATDMIMAVRFAINSIELLNDSSSGNKSTSLITRLSQPELTLSLEEESNYSQFDMVCQSASYYQSARPKTAAMSRSQLLDLFARKNGFSPGMFALTEKQQVAVGNQVTNLLLARLGSFERVTELMDKDSYIKLEDLGIAPYSDTSIELECLIENGHRNQIASKNNHNTIGNKDVE
ncbi:VPA1269 family protein [Shewanella sp. S1-49-MNA-CIBAN-0167]|uniref:VPA1269 family protein n=1 Tax=Shewanella sp. S1-49-MNA-CIBAN-0167 TaxID=3140468 RepID=UPI0033283809